MIMKFLKKIPAGMMVVPMLLGAFINTFFPQVTGIGSFTTAIFTSAGANAAIGIQLFCLGTTLRFREIGGVVKRGGVLLIAKFIIGAAIGIGVGKLCGPEGLLGLSALAIGSAVTNSAGHQRRPHAHHDRYGRRRPCRHPVHGSGCRHRPHPGGYDPGQH